MQRRSDPNKPLSRAPSKHNGFSLDWTAPEIADFLAKESRSQQESFLNDKVAKLIQSEEQLYSDLEFPPDCRHCRLFNWLKAFITLFHLLTGCSEPYAHTAFRKKHMALYWLSRNKYLASREQWIHIAILIETYYSQGIHKGEDVIRAYTASHSPKPVESAEPKDTALIPEADNGNKHGHSQIGQVQNVDLQPIEEVSLFDSTFFSDGPFGPWYWRHCIYNARFWYSQCTDHVEKFLQCKSVNIWDFIWPKWKISAEEALMIAGSTSEEEEVKVLNKEPRKCEKDREGPSEVAHGRVDSSVRTATLAWWISVHQKTRLLIPAKKTTKKEWKEDEARQSSDRPVWCAPRKRFSKRKTVKRDHFNSLDEIP